MHAMRNGRSRDSGLFLLETESIRSCFLVFFFFYIFSLLSFRALSDYPAAEKDSCPLRDLAACPKDRKRARAVATVYPLKSFIPW